MTDPNALAQRVRELVKPGANLGGGDPNPPGILLMMERLLSLLDTRTAERDEARKDSARLDWLEAHGGFSDEQEGWGVTYTRWGRGTPPPLREMIDARAAIDAATGEAK